LLKEITITTMGVS